MDNLNEFSNEALRYNAGKPRYDLIPPYALKTVVDVFTNGSLKYGDRNWEKGMNWSKCIASMKRHLAKFELGHDLDEETNLPHLSHIIANCMFLLEYYRLCPQKDDRDLKYLRPLRIGLDIDEVICDFIGGIKQKYGLEEPNSWNWSYKMKEWLKPSKELDKFYLNLKPLINPKDLLFEPTCYITNRPVSVEITQLWIENNGFPCVPVYCTTDKIKVAKNENLDVFVEDNYSTFVEMNNAGIYTLLLTQNHNKKYDVGMRRINNLNDIINRMDYFK